MRKRIIALVLCLALLPVGSSFAAGTAEDPLISLSYVDGTFIPGMLSAVKAMLSDAVKEQLARREEGLGGGMVSRELPAEYRIALSTGQSIILLSGSAELKLESGSVVNASRGLETENGALEINCRYIVCEESSALVKTEKASTLLVSASAGFIGVEEEKPLISPFEDVVAGVWWHDDIVRAYRRGLVNGMTATTFEPRGQLTIAQTIKLAACMHQLYHEGEVSLKNAPVQPWYQSYVDYCIEKGIIDGAFPAYGVSATRRQFVEIFHAALPQREYAPINDIPAGSIGDISQSAPWVDMVYEFYRAGILTGYTPNDVYDAHDFGPNSSITRAEVATIMNRMFDPSARQSFTME